VELVFTSKSVFEKVQEFRKSHKTKNLKIRSLPLFKLGLLSWSKAQHVYLTRYDFYPELLLLGLRAKKAGGSFNLLQASLLQKKRSLFNKVIYGLFDRIWAVSLKDQKRFSKLLGSSDHIMSYDFRNESILKRVAHAESKLEQRKWWQGLKERLQGASFTTMIMGSAYHDELGDFWSSDLCKKMRENSLIIIVPHKLDNESIESFRSVAGLEIIDDTQEFPRIGNLFVLSSKGVLLELYKYFDLAYIGGAKLRSVHSLLEPALSGTKPYCHERVLRSSEYEQLISLGHDPVIKSWEQIPFISSSKIEFGDMIKAPYNDVLWRS